MNEDPFSSSAEARLSGFFAWIKSNAISITLVLGLLIAAFFIYLYFQNTKKFTEDDDSDLLDLEGIYESEDNSPSPRKKNSIEDELDEDEDLIHDRKSKGKIEPISSAKNAAHLDR